MTVAAKGGLQYQKTAIDRTNRLRPATQEVEYEDEDEFVDDQRGPEDVETCHAMSGLPPLHEDRGGSWGDGKGASRTIVLTLSHNWIRTGPSLDRVQF